MSEEKDRPTLEELEARLRAARRREGGGRDETGKGIGFAARIGVELVAAVAVGTGIGWLLDEWLGTRPWLMIVFFFLGSVAGMLNVYRTMSGIGHGVGYRRTGRRDSEADRPED